MLLRNTISNTKKFFQKSLGNLKNFFSTGSYQKLPKSPVYDPFNSYTTTSTTTTAFDHMNIHHHTTSYKDLEKLYSDFTDQWDSNTQKECHCNRRTKKKVDSTTPTKQDQNEVQSPSFIKVANETDQRGEAHEYDNGNKVVMNRKKNEGTTLFSKGSREVGIRGCLVAEKLKELEMLDMSNVDHVLDIEEVLHYYSRLTCPAYLEIVDKFFMDMCAEFFGPAAAATPAQTMNSTRLRRPMSVMRS